jgi:hypothetical protein
MFRHRAIIRLDPRVGRKYILLCNALLDKSIAMIGGGTRSRFTVMCGGFGVCWVWRILIGTSVWIVRQSAWRLWALLRGWYSWAGPCVFWSSLGFVGFSVVALGFRSGSVNFLVVEFMWYSVWSTCEGAALLVWFSHMHYASEDQKTHGPAHEHQPRNRA